MEERKMTRKQFRKNLVEALIHHDCDLTNREVEEFLDLNYDEDSSLNDWTFADFNSFAIDVSCDGLRNACHYVDLKHWEDEEDE
jgi:hypothetical protein